MFFNTWYTSSITSEHVTHYRPHHNYHHILLLKSSSLSASYMRRGIGSALVQIMACCLFGSKPISKPMLAIVNRTVRNKLQWLFIRIQNISFTKNDSENIASQMAAIMSKRWWVNSPWVWSPTLSIRFHPWGHVDCITEQTEARHCQAYHPYKLHQCPVLLTLMSFNPAQISNTSIIKCGMKLLHSQTSTAAPLRFSNG